MPTCTLPVSSHTSECQRNMEHAVKSLLKTLSHLHADVFVRLAFQKQSVLINSEGKLPNLAQSLLLIKISQLLRLSVRLCRRHPSVFMCLFLYQNQHRFVLDECVCLCSRVALLHVL